MLERFVRLRDRGYLCRSIFISACARQSMQLPPAKSPARHAAGSFRQPRCAMAFWGSANASSLATARAADRYAAFTSRSLQSVTQPAPGCRAGYRRAAAATLHGVARGGLCKGLPLDKTQLNAANSRCCVSDAAHCTCNHVGGWQSLRRRRCIAKLNAQHSRCGLLRQRPPLSMQVSLLGAADPAVGRDGQQRAGH